MKHLFFIVLLVVVVVVCWGKVAEVDGYDEEGDYKDQDHDTSIISRAYPISGNFKRIHASGHMQFELTYANSKPNLTIETEKWVHDCCINVIQKRGEGIFVRLTKTMEYPPIKVYITYKTPLVGLKTSGVATLKSKNTIRTDPSSTFSISHSGASSADLQLQHASDINIDISGTSYVSLSGQVQGNGKISVSGIARLNALSCPMKSIKVNTSGTAVAHINGKNGIDAYASGVSVVYYKGPIKTAQTSGIGSIRPTSLNKPMESLAVDEQEMPTS